MKRKKNTEKIFIDRRVMIKKKTIKDLTREELIKELEARNRIIKCLCKELEAND